MKKITAKISSHSDEPKPIYRAECEKCGKEIAFSKADITHGAYGCVMVDCPHCFVQCKTAPYPIKPAPGKGAFLLQNKIRMLK
ncbi:MAG: hypothetical protein IJZ58_04710 [Oscillospiraceae bacterium]|nr:hypothetical protein [Oscillospiraceae bacterium]